MQIFKMILISSVLTLTACASSSNTTPNNEEHTKQAAYDLNNKGAYKVKKENCDIKSETQKYIHLVGKDTTVEMLWHDIHPSAKDIRFPFKVTGYTDEGLIIFPHKFPLQELYMGLLFGSGHLLYKGELIILDLCSANITEQDELSPYQY